jgi:hypothetical protein
VEQVSSKPAELGPEGNQRAGIQLAPTKLGQGSDHWAKDPMEHGSGGPTQSWGPEGPRGGDPGRAWIQRFHVGPSGARGAGIPAVPHGAVASGGLRGWVHGGAGIRQSHRNWGPVGPNGQGSRWSWGLAGQGAQRSTGSTGLWGEDLVGQLFFQ